MIHAPIKYFGGKSLMLGKIYPHFPEPTYDVYIEPFAGSYSVGFNMPYIPPIEIMNDLNGNVYSLYKVIQDEGMFNQFKNRLDLTPYSEDLRYEAIDELKRDDLSMVERAYWFFVRNRLSRNGIGGFSVNLLIRRNMAKSVSDYLSAIDGLPELHARLSKTIIYNRDALDLMDKYNQSNCFIYCDPPYVWSTRGATRYDIDQDDEFHKKFIDKCINSKAKILISGYDNDLYTRLEENGFTKVLFDVKTVSGTGEKKTKTEALWKNY